MPLAALLVIVKSDPVLDVAKLCVVASRPFKEYKPLLPQVAVPLASLIKTFPSAGEPPVTFKVPSVAPVAFKVPLVTTLVTEVLPN